MQNKEELKALLSSPVPSDCGDHLPAPAVATIDKRRRKRRRVVAAAAGLGVLFVVGGLAISAQTPVGQQALEYAGARLSVVQEWWSAATAKGATQTDVEESELDGQMLEETGLDLQEQVEEIADVGTTVLEETETEISKEYSLVDEIAPNGFINTQPAFPPGLLKTSPNRRYLSYLPHSGFHNQRIELQNALILAFILNRTLITPLVRLGAPQTYKDFSLLEHQLTQAQKTQGERPLSETCRTAVPELERAKKDHRAFKGSKRCAKYLDYTEITWPLISNLSSLSDSQSIIPRTDINHTFFTKTPSEGGLGLKDSDVYRLPGANDRYGVQFYDSVKSKTQEGKYGQRLNTADLLQPPYSDYAALELGTIYGGARVRISDPTNKAQVARIGKSMVFHNRMLDAIAQEIVQRFGGADKYLGVHLRVGDGFFERNAAANMEGVFTEVATKAFGLSSEEADKLYTANKVYKQAGRMARRSHSFNLPKSFSATDGLSQSDFLHTPLVARQSVQEYPTRQEMPMHQAMQCRGDLHTTPAMVKFNQPIYIATDSHTPLSDPNMAVFFNVFPCAFLLPDFVEATAANSLPVTDLTKMTTLRSKQDGVKLGHFLYPFLEAMVVARSRIGTHGTRMSTFSNFAVNVLHKAYSE